MERGDRARAGALQKPRRRSDRQEQTFVTSGQLRGGRRRALRVKTTHLTFILEGLVVCPVVWRSVRVCSGINYPQ